MRGFRQKPAIFLSDEKFKFKYLITDKHILRFAQIIKTVAKKAFCLIAICVSCYSGLLGRRSEFCKYFVFSISFSLSLSLEYLRSHSTGGGEAVKTGQR